MATMASSGSATRPGISRLRMRAPPSHTMPPVMASSSAAEPKSGCSNSSTTMAAATPSGLISAIHCWAISSR